MNGKFERLVLTIVALGILALAGAGSSSSATQSRSRNGNLQITQYSHVVITGSDVRSLPPGENRIVHQDQSGNTTYVGSPNGGVWKLINSNSDGGTNLTKTGTGTLILPNANTRQGTTYVNPGTVRNTDNGGANAVKELTGTLILANDSGVVYEFRNLGVPDFDRVMIADAGGARAAYLKFEAFLQQQHPAGGMKGWPFARVLMGQPQGIAQVEGWKPGLTGKKPGSKYVCSGGSCICSGSSDCLSLVANGACAGSMVCTPAGCSCTAKMTLGGL